jgi:hypothetical protein
MQFYCGTARKERGCHFYDSLCPTYCPQYKRIEQKDEKGGGLFLLKWRRAHSNIVSKIAMLTATVPHIFEAVLDSLDCDLCTSPTQIVQHAVFLLY